MDQRVRTPGSEDLSQQVIYDVYFIMADAFAAYYSGNFIKYKCRHPKVCKNSIIFGKGGPRDRVVKAADFIIPLNHSNISPMWLGLGWGWAPSSTRVTCGSSQDLLAGQVFFPGVLPFLPHRLNDSSRYE